MMSKARAQGKGIKLEMKSDRICWIDSRTIKRGCVLMIDGSLVPFCLKCLVACMRANGVLERFEKD